MGLIGLAVLLVAAGCGGSDQSERRPGTATAAGAVVVTEQAESDVQDQDGAAAGADLETETPDEVTKIDADSEPSPDAAFYAEDRGISLEEALRRLDLQDAFGSLNLETKLRANAGDTYAGSWIQHEPTFGIVVVFTVPVADGERIVRPYIEGTPFSELTEVRQAQFTIAELETQRSTAEAMFAANGVRFGSSLNVFENRVEISPTGVDLANALISDGTISLPPAVVILAGVVVVVEAE